MQLSYITLGENGQATCQDENDNELFLQLPITPDSQNYINGEPLDIDAVKDYQEIIDEHFGNGDRTLARLCYAGGKEYESYTTNGNTYITNNGDEFVEHPYAEFYNVELYTRNEYK